MGYYMSEEYQRIISENFDLRDDNTLSVLTGINEADQSKVLEGLTARLYQMIVSKAADIDFGSIPYSKGDITQVEGYQNLIECITILKDLLIEYKQDVAPIVTVQEAISNIQERTVTWQKAYAIKADFPIIIYQSIVLAIYSSVSLLISTSIEYIKDAGEDLFSVKLDKVAYVKNKNGLLFDNLKKFNNCCKNGELDKSLDHIFKNITKNFVGGAAVTIASIVGIAAVIVSIIPITRELIYLFYYSRQQISDFFTIQADLVQINAEYVKNNEYLAASNRKEISRKQQKISDLFRKIGNAIAVSIRTGEKSAKNAQATESRKLKVTEVSPEKLDSYEDEGNNSSLF